MALNPIKVNLDELLINTEQTYLTAAATLGTATLTVGSIQGFAINQILLVGEFGDRESEIIKTHTATAPTGSTITLNSNLVFNHPRHTRVYLLNFDQIEFYHAATATGAKTLMTTSTIEADETETRYNDTTYSSGYYFTRYKNSILTTYSDYTDAMPYEGLEDNTVGKVMDEVLRNSGITFGDRISYDFMIDEINTCLRDITAQLKRWSKLEEFDYPLGQTARGLNKWALPTTIENLNSNKSIISVRIGTGDAPLTYKDKREWNEILADVKHTQVRTAATAGETSLAIDNSYDFDSSGSVMISGNTITYTGITRSATAGVLTGIPASGTGAITESIAVDTDVWQDYEEGQPFWFTVYDGYLYIWYLCDSTWINKNVFADLYLGPTQVDSDTDTLTADRYDMVKNWLMWKVRAVSKNDGEAKLDDPDYKRYLAILGNSIKKETSGQKYKMKPKINSIMYKPVRTLDFKHD